MFKTRFASVAQCRILDVHANYMIVSDGHNNFNNSVDVEVDVNVNRFKRV